MPSSAIWPRFVDGGGGDSQRCYKTGEVFWARQGLFWAYHTSFSVGGGPSRRSVKGSNRGLVLQHLCSNSIFAGGWGGEGEKAAFTAT